MAQFKVEWQEITYCEVEVEAEDEASAIEQAQLLSSDDLDGAAETYFDSNLGHIVTKIEALDN